MYICAKNSRLLTDINIASKNIRIVNNIKFIAKKNFFCNFFLSFRLFRQKTIHQNKNFIINKNIDISREKGS